MNIAFAGISCFSLGRASASSYDVMPRSERRRSLRVPIWTCPHCSFVHRPPICCASTSTTCSASHAVECSQLSPTSSPNPSLRPKTTCDLNLFSVNIRRRDRRRGRTCLSPHCRTQGRPVFPWGRTLVRRHTLTPTRNGGSIRLSLRFSAQAKRVSAFFGSAAAR